MDEVRWVGEVRQGGGEFPVRREILPRPLEKRNVWAVARKVDDNDITRQHYLLSSLLNLAAADREFGAEKD